MNGWGLRSLSELPSPTTPVQSEDNRMSRVLADTGVRGGQAKALEQEAGGSQGRSGSSEITGPGVSGYARCCRSEI